jgi:hypothetical protein
LRQARNYGALHEAQQQAEEPQASPAARQPRNYEAVRETQHQVDEQQASSDNRPERPTVQRSWSHYGGMASQQESANEWIRQNNEIRAKMAETAKSGASREGQGTQSPQQGQDAAVQRAQAAVEDARRREAAERGRQQERERSGPER